jgi:hypothetical protein
MPWTLTRINRNPDDPDGGGGIEPPSDAEPAESWLDSFDLPDDVRESKTLAQHKDAASALKSYVNAERMLGDRIPMPDPGDEAAMNELYDKLGRPASANEYELPKDGMPKDVQLDESLLASAYEEGHRLGLTKRQMAGMVRWQAEAASAAAKQYDESSSARIQEAAAKLRADFGEAYDQEMELAQTAAASFGGEELWAELTAAGVGNNPNVIKAFAKVGRAMADDEIIGSGGRSKHTPTTENAMLELTRLQADPAFMERYGKGEEAAVKQMTELFAAAFPGEVSITATTG